MLIVKNGHGELVAKSDTNAAEFASSVAFASMGVFHGLAALKGLQLRSRGPKGGSAPAWAPGAWAPGAWHRGVGAGGEGSVGTGAGRRRGLRRTVPPQTTPFTVKEMGMVSVAETVPRSTMPAVSPGESVRFHSPGVTFTSAPVWVATPFHEAVTR